MTRMIHGATVRLNSTLLIAAALCLGGCKKEEDGTAQGPAGAAPGAAVADAGPAEAGSMKGTAVDSQGKPLAKFGGSIYGYSLKSGQSQSLNIDGASGQYRVNTGPGQFSARAWVDVNYNGHPYRIDLHPVDGETVLHKYDTTNGVVKNFVWKLDGYRPGNDERDENRNYGFYGGSIMLYAEGNGAQYQADVLSNYSAKAEPKIPPESTVEVTLTPDGPLIDGSQGKPVVLKSKPSDIHNYMDRLTRGIPIARYKATAREITADGQTKPLRVVRYDSFKRTKPIGPDSSIVVEFLQRNAPSDNVNGVEEVNLLVLY